ncbi:SIR2 family NAD-dependent protein deacylase [Catalinimonas niigatensis]|uniref:SIR2 family NAD-dependent protein deacylase n=1 Tax=Catalinimonas niigatensis TaxID=1397264 RepID=UPI002665C23B|nr:NAD-dependent deacylase [Catalinimonas niigatensis]WPP49700.1 NAD-dependent deacylase [Catalinimonas niigatensis]
MQKVVVLSGSGISAESGIPTFRDAGGLWEGFDINDVATPQAWQKNPQLVLEFYNQRRKAALEAKPNAGHLSLVELEKYFDVVIITQNVDGLHEKAGSSKVIHLHGELSKARSTVDESLIYDIEGWEIKWGEMCEKNAQLRPHIVWFGEMVPMMEVAYNEVVKADICVVVGTSLQVYPAAGLLNDVTPGTPIYIVDPTTPAYKDQPYITPIQESASTGLPKLVKQLIKEAQ